MIEQRFDAVSADQPAESIPTPPHHSDGTNGVKHEQDADDEVSGEIKVSTSASKKRTSSMVEDEDARLARELQAQENQLARGRQTRGGHSAPKPKSKPKKKSSAKVKSGDDSDVDTEDSGAVKKRKAGGGFQKEFNLSYSLADLVGAERVRFARTRLHRGTVLILRASSCPDPKLSRSSGSTSRRTTCRIPATSARLSVTTGCARCLSKTRSTCSK